MHRRLGSATLLQLAFPRESNPNFPQEKSHWDNTVVKSKKKKKKGRSVTSHFITFLIISYSIDYWAIHTTTLVGPACSALLRCTMGWCIYICDLDQTWMRSFMSSLLQMCPLSAVHSDHSSVFLTLGCWTVVCQPHPALCQTWPQCGLRPSQNVHGFFLAWGDFERIFDRSLPTFAFFFFLFFFWSGD